MPGALDAADARQAVAAVIDQRIDQRAVPVARAGWTTRPGGLAINDQVLVLIEDIERDVLAHRLGVFRFGQVDDNAVAWLDDFAVRTSSRAPFSCTAPCSISDFTRLRENSCPRAAVNQASMRLRHHPGNQLFP